MSKEMVSSKWDLWRSSIEPKEMQQFEEFQQAIKKAKRAGKMKLLLSFGVGTALGTGVTAFISWKLFKFLGGLLNR